MSSFAAEHDGHPFIGTKLVAGAARPVYETAQADGTRYYVTTSGAKSYCSVGSKADANITLLRAAPAPTTPLSKPSGDADEFSPAGVEHFAEPRAPLPAPTTAAARSGGLAAEHDGHPLVGTKLVAGAARPVYETSQADGTRYYMTASGAKSYCSVGSKTDVNITLLCAAVAPPASPPPSASAAGDRAVAKAPGGAASPRDDDEDGDKGDSDEGDSDGDDEPRPPDFGGFDTEHDGHQLIGTKRVDGASRPVYETSKPDGTRYYVTASGAKSYCSVGSKADCNVALLRVAAPPPLLAPGEALACRADAHCSVHATLAKVRTPRVAPACDGK